MGEQHVITAPSSRSTGDLARDGGGTIEQVAAAYTLLRFVARTERGAIARQARSDAERLLTAPALARLDGAPYRDRLPADLALPAEV